VPWDTGRCGNQTLAPEIHSVHDWLSLRFGAFLVCDTFGRKESYERQLTAMRERAKQDELK
jgi:hypothetical protein